MRHQRHVSGDLQPDPPIDLRALVHHDLDEKYVVNANCSNVRSYRVALGREVIELGFIEFRILTLLAARPYFAFSRQAIAEAVTSPERPITADQIDTCIASLLNQLGVFHDYVQTVPYIGYRFKA